MELITGLADEWFQPDENDAARFLLTPLDQLTWISIDALSGRGDLAGAMRTALLAGIKNWENVNLNGTPVAFGKDDLLSHIKKIQRKTLYDLYSKLNEISSLVEDDEKNS